MKLKVFAPVALACALLGACESNMQNNPKQLMGGAAGAGLGALAGSQIGSGKGQIAAAVIGGLAGMFMGSEVGKSLDRADHMYMQQAATKSFEYAPTGTATAWRNPDSGHSGTITPIRTYQQSGQDCRDYQTTVTIDGKQEVATGRACRQGDGTWRVQNS
jgi:surface antigen